MSNGCTATHSATPETAPAAKSSSFPAGMPPTRRSAFPSAIARKIAEQMRLVCVYGGAKHELDAEPSATIAHVKDLLAAKIGLDPSSQRLLLKGKEAAPTSTLADLQCADGTKMMVLKNQQGHRTTPAAPAGAAASSAASASAAPAPAPAPAPAELDPPIGAGPIALSVKHGKRTLTVRCEAGTSVLAVKTLLEPLVGARAAQHRLLLRGREASPDTKTIDELGLGGGGTLMLLFREARNHAKPTPNPSPMTSRA